MIIRDSHIVWIGGIVTASLVGGTMLVKWNNPDGPGTHGGGEDLNRQVDVPMADEREAPRAEQRQGSRATISGAVRDGDGAAIAGATVCAQASSTLLSASDTQWPRCVDTGADGRYVLGDLFGVRQRVSASAADHLPTEHVHMLSGVRRRAIELRPGGAAQDVDVILERGGAAVRGVVMDLQGRPIAGARVTGGGADGGTAMVWGMTGADGRYVLWLRPGTVTVTAQATGKTIGGVTGPSEGDELSIYLAPASVLRGQVVRADDRTPIEGAWVRASATGGAVQTDASGRFTIGGLAAGLYTPWAEDDEWFGMATEQRALGLGEAATSMVIAAMPAVFVEGRIVHRDGGAPCDEGTLSLTEAVSGREIHDVGEPDGLVHVRGLLPGKYAVRVTCKGTVAEDHRLPLVVGKRDVLAQTWEVSDGRAIAGVVVDAGGAPVAGVTLAARPSDGGAGPAEVVSDAQGKFLLRGLVAGAVRVVPASHARRTMPDMAVDVTIGDADLADVKVALAATGEVRGALRDPEGQPLAGAELALRTAWGEQRTVAGADGGFQFTRAAIGESAISASLGGAPLSTRAHPRIRVRVGATTTVALVSVATPGVIAGVLGDEQGRPLAGAVVVAQVEGTKAVDRGPPHLTDAAGKFSIPGLAGVLYTITARPPGGGEARREHVPIGETPILTLAPRGRVRGTVVAPGGGAPDSFTVEVVDVRTGQRRGETFVATAGAWGFDGLASGDLEIKVRAREGVGVKALKLAVGEAQDTVRIAVVGAATLRGTVLDLRGAPVPALEVGLSSARGVVSDMRAVTDAAGRFELSRVSVGPMFVTVGPPGGRMSPFAQSRVAIEVPVDQARIELPAIRVAERRIAVGGSRGELGYTIAASAADDDPLLADLKVAIVRPAGPASAAGLLPHDEIVSVDDQDVRGANRSLYATLTEVPAGTTVRLGLARGVTVAITATARR